MIWSMVVCVESKVCLPFQQMHEFLHHQVLFGKGPFLMLTRESDFAGKLSPNVKNNFLRLLVGMNLSLKVFSGSS